MKLIKMKSMPRKYIFSEKERLIKSYINENKDEYMNQVSKKLQDDRETYSQ